MAEVRVAASGRWGTVEWAIDGSGTLPAKAFFDALGADDQAKVLALFMRLAEHGPEALRNREKFRNLGQKAGKLGKDLFEFKSFQIRMLGDYRKGRRFLVAHAMLKKQDRLPERDVARAVRILEENDNFEASRTQRR